LPLLYCQDEGIDGVFSQKVGERCKDASDIEIASSLEKIIMNYNTYELDKIDFSIFRWENIAKVYYNLYTSVIHP